MSPASLLKWLHTIISIRCQEVVPSSSDSNQVVVEQWETESDSSSRSLSLKMEENIVERFFRFPFLFSSHFSQCGTLLETHEKDTLCTPCKLFSSPLMNEIHFWISFWERRLKMRDWVRHKRKSRPPVVSWTESNRAGRGKRDYTAFWLYFTVGSG